MNRTEAWKLDSKVGVFYVELDDDTDQWCVFGSESGFAYSSYTDERDAEKSAKTLNEYAR